MQFAKRRAIAISGISIIIVALFVISGATTATAASGWPWTTVPTTKSPANPTPVMGWSGWSFLRRYGYPSPDPYPTSIVSPTNTSENAAQQVEGEALGMVTSGLASVGYKYVNIDDMWYQCPNSSGPLVDKYGRWIIDPIKFPPGPNGENGIQVVANYVHSLGLKFGIYNTGALSGVALAKNTTVLGTKYGADQIVARYPNGTAIEQANYNCGGGYLLNYKAPGTQAWINSIVDEWASWGADYIKLDGVNDCAICNSSGITMKDEVRDWSRAILQSHRLIVLGTTEGDYYITMAPWMQKYANSYEMACDVEHGAHRHHAYPFTTYAHWGSGTYGDGSTPCNRFIDEANWAPYAGPYGTLDLDSLEVGDGPAVDGMNSAASMSMMSLWALASSTWVLGVTLSSKVINGYGDSFPMNSTELGWLKNPQIIEVDQDNIAARCISGCVRNMTGPGTTYNVANPGTPYWPTPLVTSVDTVAMYAKVEPSGDAILGIFNRDTTLTDPHVTVSTNATTMAALYRLGLPRDPLGYTVLNIWTGATWTIGPSGVIICGTGAPTNTCASLPPEGVALLRITPIRPIFPLFANLWSIPTLLSEEWSGIASRLSQFSL